MIYLNQIRGSAVKIISDLARDAALPGKLEVEENRFMRWEGYGEKNWRYKAGKNYELVDTKVPVLTRDGYTAPPKKLTAGWDLSVDDNNCVWARPVCAGWGNAYFRDHGPELVRIIGKIPERLRKFLSAEESQFLFFCCGQFGEVYALESEVLVFRNRLKEMFG
ncbi:MAG: hypothetical protein AAB473_04010 [Patescibacteria group bacterium]